MAAQPTHGVLRSEECDIHYWHQGSGPLIVFVPGGHGHGLQFFPMLAALSDRYTCATFDRRQMSASKSDKPNKLNPPQQARDILAVIKALGFEKAIVFGSSLGGTLALQLAHDHPQHVEHVISHEAPTFMLIPEASQIFEWTQSLMQIYEREGYEAAERTLDSQMASGKKEKEKDESLPPNSKVAPENHQNAWKYELEMAAIYIPNLYRIREQGTSIGLMRGVRSGDNAHSKAVLELEKILACLRMDMPGGHQAFENETAAFVPAFLQMLQKLEDRKKQ